MASQQHCSGSHAGVTALPGPLPGTGQGTPCTGGVTGPGALGVQQRLKMFIVPAAASSSQSPPITLQLGHTAVRACMHEGLMKVCMRVCVKLCKLFVSVCVCMHVQWTCASEHPACVCVCGGGVLHVCACASPCCFQLATPPRSQGAFLGEVQTRSGPPAFLRNPSSVLALPAGTGSKTCLRSWESLEPGWSRPPGWAGPAGTLVWDGMGAGCSSQACGNRGVCVHPAPGTSPCARVGAAQGRGGGTCECQTQTGRGITALCGIHMQFVALLQQGR